MSSIMQSRDGVRPSGTFSCAIRRLTLGLLTTALAVGTLAGCRDAVAPEDRTARVSSSVPSSVPQLLVGVSGTQVWRPLGTAIPMCWHELLQFPNPAAAAAAKAFVTRTIEDGWISLLNLHITWVDCPTSTLSGVRHVRIKLRSGDPSYNGTTLQLGTATLSTAVQRQVQPPNDPPGLLMGFPANWNDSDRTRATFRSLILHEFGHVLGFTHEQLRPDGPQNVPCYDDPLPGAITIGPPDPRSIMGWSYCTEALGVLTPDDVRSARAVYGTGRSGSNDFNRDGRGDILWHNATTGETQVWLMSGASRIGRATVVAENRTPIFVGAPWRLVGSNDMNGDGRTDILWHNDVWGETQVWLMDDTRIAGRVTVVDERGAPILVGAPWSFVGTNDMNGDGQPDILWHNDVRGETQVWLMHGVRIAGRVNVLAENGLPLLVGLPWRIVATGDMNADGRPDILWHNATTNETQVWLVSGARVIGRATVRDERGVPIFVGLPWSIVGANDFDQNGRADLLWHNAATSETQMWLM
jgi:hypothetical protein